MGSAIYSIAFLSFAFVILRCHRELLSVMFNFVSMWRCGRRQRECVNRHTPNPTTCGVVGVGQVVVLELAQLMVATSVPIQTLQSSQLQVSVTCH